MSIPGARPVCTILLPLTPTKSFVAPHDRKTEHYIDRRDKTEVEMPVNDEVAGIAAGFVYGRTKGHLRFVGDRLSRTPSHLLGSNS